MREVPNSFGFFFFFLIYYYNMELLIHYTYVCINTNLPHSIHLSPHDTFFFFFFCRVGSFGFVGRGEGKKYMGR